MSEKALAVEAERPDLAIKRGGESTLGSGREEQPPPVVQDPHGIHGDRPIAGVRQHSSDDGGGEDETVHPEWDHNVFGSGVVADAVRQQQNATIAADATGDYGSGGGASEKPSPICSERASFRYFLVAGTGFEPVTFGL